MTRRVLLALLAVLALVLTGPAVGQGNVGWAQVALANAPSHTLLRSCSAQLGASLYVFGGQNRPSGVATYYNDLLVLNTITNTWTQVTTAPAPAWPIARGECAMTVIGTTLYMSGGGVLPTTYSDLWAFDTVTSVWAELTAMPAAVRLHSLVPIPASGALLVVDLSTLTSVNVFTPGSTFNAAGSWSTIAASAIFSMGLDPTGTEAAGVVALSVSSSLLHVFTVGGIIGSTFQNQVNRLAVDLTVPAAPVFTWTLVTMSGTAPSARLSPSVVALGSYTRAQTTFLVTGGYFGTGYNADAFYMFVSDSASTGTWMSAAPATSTAPVASGSHPSAVSTSFTNALVLVNETTAFLSSPVYASTSVSPSLVATTGGHVITLSGAPLLASTALASPTHLSLVHSVTRVVTACPLTGSVTVGAISCTVPAGLAVTLGVAGSPSYLVQVEVVSGALPPISLSALTVVPANSAASVTDATGDFAVPVNSPTAITIVGTGAAPFLAASQSDLMSVTIGGAACTSATFVSTSSVRCTTPALASGKHALVVTSSSGGVSPSAIVYAVPAATVSLLDTTAGRQSGGQPLVLTGTWLSGASVSLAALPSGSSADGTIDNSVTAVTIGGAACVVTASSTTSISCTTSAFPAAGLFPVVVTTRQGGSSSSAALFNVVAAPVVSLISPSTGAAGDLVTISGSTLGLDAGDIASITIGGATCTVASVSGSPVTTLTCTLGTPATLGAFDVIVTTNSGGVGSSSTQFTYRAASTGSSQLARSSSSPSTFDPSLPWLWVVIASCLLCCILCLLLLLLLWCLRRRNRNKEPEFVDPMLNQPYSYEYTYYSDDEPQPVAAPRRKIIDRRRARPRTVGFDPHGVEYEEDAVKRRRADAGLVDDTWLSSSLNDQDEPDVLI